MSTIALRDLPVECIIQYPTAYRKLGGVLFEYHVYFTGTTISITGNDILSTIQLSTEYKYVVNPLVDIHCYDINSVTKTIDLLNLPAINTMTSNASIDTSNRYYLESIDIEFLTTGTRFIQVYFTLCKIYANSNIVPTEP